MPETPNNCSSILIVEDEDSIRQTLCDVFELKGFAVYSASNGEEGITELRKMPKKPCVVLLDLMMPVKNGWNFLDVQRNDPALSDIPVIICSAYEESAKSIHCDAYVAKPLQLATLFAAIEKFCPEIVPN